MQSPYDWFPNDSLSDDPDKPESELPTGRPGAGVFGYRPPSASSRLMMLGDEPADDDELLTDDDGNVAVTIGELRQVIRVELQRTVHVRRTKV